MLNDISKDWFDLLGCKSQSTAANIIELAFWTLEMQLMQIQGSWVLSLNKQLIVLYEDSIQKTFAYWYEYLA